VGLSEFRPHLPHNLKKHEEDRGLQKVVGQVGLARARVIWRGIKTRFFLPNEEVYLNISPLGNNGDSRPHLPQSLISCESQRAILKIA
jgi:hypothetical protein